jgi:hypothetical protein
MGSSQAVWALRITARDRYSDDAGAGPTSGYLIGPRCRSPRKALEGCNDRRRSSGRAERYRCVAAPQRYSFKHPLITRPDLGRAIYHLPEPLRVYAAHIFMRCRRTVGAAGDLEWPTVSVDPHAAFDASLDRRLTPISESMSLSGCSI